MIRITALAALCLATACSYDPVQSQRPVELSPREINEVKQAVKHDLIDANSAEFRNFRGVIVTKQNSGEQKIVCGEVNAKNRAGGYNGFLAFYTWVDSKGKADLKAFDTVGSLGVANIWCRQHFGEQWRNR